jgi:hypothetical protein
VNDAPDPQTHRLRAIAMTIPRQLIEPYSEWRVIAFYTARDTGLRFCAAFGAEELRASGGEVDQLAHRRPGF